MSRPWSIMYVSKLYEASRIASGAQREPERKEHVRSNGTPNMTTRALSNDAIASANRREAIPPRTDSGLKILPSDG